MRFLQSDAKKHAGLLVLGLTTAAAARFDGGPSLMEASRAIGKAREERVAVLLM